MIQMTETHYHTTYQVIALTHFVYFTETEPEVLINENGMCIQPPELKVEVKKMKLSTQR